MIRFVFVGALAGAVVIGLAWTYIRAMRVINQAQELRVMQRALMGITTKLVPIKRSLRDVLAADEDDVPFLTTSQRAAIEDAITAMSNREES